MLRGGGLCVAAPTGDSSLPRVSPRIRALQDRLLDSLPADGAWECLSPAQREAIISLHRARLTRNLQEREVPTGKQYNRKFNKGFARYGRSRSYEDKLESETDDSGVRLQSGGTSSTSNSQNSQEDDSSDPGIKKVGRFTKSPSADRILKKDAKALHDPSKRKGVTNGVGNVNKIISKQLTKAGHHHSPSKVTLDCRNLQEDRSRCRIDKNSPFFFETSEDAGRAKKPGISRRNILQRYDVNKEAKGSASSEDFEGYAPYHNKNNSRKSPDRYRKKVPLPSVDYDVEADSDQTPRTDSTPSPTALRFPAGFQEERSRYSWTEGIVGSSSTQVSIDRKQNAQNGYNAKLNSSFDYRNEINQDPLNKYSSNWNTIILNNHIPIRPSRAHQNKSKSGPRPVKATEPFSSNSSGDSGYRGEPSRTSSDSWYRDESRRFSGGDPGCKGGSSGRPRFYEDNSYREESIEQHSGDSGYKLDAGRPTVSRQDRVSSKKYIRSKSLDRNFLDESTDDESDFEFRRRTDRLLRYTKASQEADIGKLPQEGKSYADRRYNRQTGKAPEASVGRKSKSAWDLSVSNRHQIPNDFQEFEDNCFRSRSNIINKWRSQDGDFILSDNNKPSLTNSGGEFSRLQWQRRSCDIDLDFSEAEPGKKKAREDKQSFDKKQWHRRSLDGQLDMDEEESSHRRRMLYDQDWDDTISKEMRIIQHREFLKQKEEVRKMAVASQPPSKDSRQKNARYERHRQDGAQLHRGQAESAPVAFYPKSTCPDHGWVTQEYEGRSHPKSKLGQYPAPKKDRHKGPFRGKLKLFRSILFS